MTNKPELPLELLNGSIAHIEGLKAKTALLFGKKNLLSDAIISMDLCGHSYDYSELIVMRDRIIEAKQKMDGLEAKRQAVLNMAVCNHNLMNGKSNRPKAF